MMTQAPPAQMPGTGMTPHRGVMILVFGILSWVLCLIFGIIAWVMGHGDLKQMEAGQMDPAGEGMTRAGMIVGMINVIVSIVAIIICVLLLILGVIGAAAAGAAGAAGGP